MLDRRKFSEVAHFTGKQILATETADANKYTLFGGSRGPGKSYWLRWYALRLLGIYKKQFGIERPVVGLFCEDYPTLKDRQISKIEAEFPDWLGELKSTQAEGLGFHLHDGGYIALRNLDKPKKYQSAEFLAVLVDELTKNTRDTFDILRASVRWPGIPSQWLKFIGATNPGDIGHLWVKDLWIDRIYPPELEPLSDWFAFVPALPDDNPHLPDDYWVMLESLPPDLARAWRWGDWDVFEGQVFSEWRRDLHVCTPFKIPDDATRIVAIDWGYAAPWCALWIARCKLDHDDYSPEFTRRIVYREAYKPELTDPEQVEEIQRLTAPDEWIDAYTADPSMWTARTVGKRAISTADVYRDLGIRLRKGENDRLTGKRRVHEALSLLPDGRPGLLVFENCRNLIRTLPALPYDETRVEDVDDDAEDHAYDALRYGLSHKPPKNAPPKPAPDDYWAEVRGKKRRRRPLDTPLELQELQDLTR